MTVRVRVITFTDVCRTLAQDVVKNRHQRRDTDHREEFSIEERDQLSVEHKNAVGNRRAVWYKQQAADARDHAVKLEAELQRVYAGIFTTMDENLMSTPSTGESKVFYCNMKRDDYRHLAELATCDAKSKAAEDACVAYAEATKGQKTVEVPQVVYIDKIGDVSVVTQRSVPTIQIVQQMFLLQAENTPCLETKRSLGQKRWICENTKVGPVLEVTVIYHQGCHGIEIQINSQSGDGSGSCVRTSAGMNKYVWKCQKLCHSTMKIMNRASTGRLVKLQPSSLETANGASTGGLVVELKPKRTTPGTSSSGPQTKNEIPIHEREWIDVEPEAHDAHSFGVAKKMNKLLRHEHPHLREEDKAIAFRDLVPVFVSQFTVLVNSNMAPSFEERRRSQE